MGIPADNLQAEQKKAYYSEGAFMDKLTDVKKYRDTMCPECRNDVKLLGAILKVQDISLELIKNERELIKTIKEINKNNPNRQATE